MKTQTLLTKWLPYIVAIVLFIFIALVYCAPVIQGKRIQQSDVRMATGMQKELNDYHKETGKYTLWTNSMFGGMPTYQIGRAGVPDYNVFSFFSKLIRLKLPPYSVDLIFVYLIGFFILLIALGVNPWLSIVGAIAFAFASNNFVLISVGHVNKALVIGLMPAVLAGVLLIYKQKYVWGAIITIISVGVHIYFNHVQMTYYLLIALAILIITELVYHFKEKRIKVFFISSLIALGSALLGVAPNLANLITTYEYSKDTNRGPSELTQTVKENDTKGIDKEYALRWSYGKVETFTFLIPNLYGGASEQNFGEKSNVYDALLDNGVDRSNAKQVVSAMPTTTYWGDQPFTQGPVYLGAIVCFLFVLGLFLVDRKTRTWVLGAVIVTVFLSWGRNFMAFTDLFFNYVPMYNKFRAVSTILVIPTLLFPFVAFLGLKRLMENEIAKKDFMRYFKISLGITGGFSLFFLLFGGALFSFSNPIDADMVKGGYPQWIVDAVEDQRLSLLRKDAFRSLIFILLGATLVFAFYLKKIKFQYFVLLLGIFILIDMWGVNTRYLNKDNFVAARKANQITPSQANIDILKDNDPDFRVFNLTMNPFTETFTSYFHKSLGGYHGAKLKRYDELISYHLSKQNQQVINMLNTKYFIVPDKNKQPMAYPNPGALGNAWFIKELTIVNNADEEINALNNFDAAKTAFMDKRFLEKVPQLAGFKPDSIISGQIKLTSYAPDQLKYESQTSTDEFAVFSEIYYNSGKGWDAYIDGNKAEHIRVNYVLRGMLVPAGKHTIEFKFEPKSFYNGLKIEMISSIIAAVVILLLINLWYKNRSKSSVPEVENEKA